MEYPNYSAGRRKCSFLLTRFSKNQRGLKLHDSEPQPQSGNEEAGVYTQLSGRTWADFLSTAPAGETHNTLDEDKHREVFTLL